VVENCLVLRADLGGTAVEATQKRRAKAQVLIMALESTAVHGNLGLGSTSLS
jgi:hypothetical protein